MMPLEEQVKELFGVVLKVSVREITDETRPADLERWDSLQHLILVSSFEEEFNLDIEPDEAVEMYKDFGTFKNIVISKMKSA
jgi:acyl carrier protein